MNSQAVTNGGDHLAPSAVKPNLNQDYSFNVCLSKHSKIQTLSRALKHEQDFKIHLMWQWMNGFVVLICSDKLFAIAPSYSKLRSCLDPDQSLVLEHLVTGLPTQIQNSLFIMPRLLKTPFSLELISTRNKWPCHCNYRLQQSLFIQTLKMPGKW